MNALPHSLYGLCAVKQIVDDALDTAYDAGVRGAINWGDLRVEDVRQCQGLVDRAWVVIVTVKEADPNNAPLVAHIQAALVAAGYRNVEVNCER